MCRGALPAVHEDTGTCEQTGLRAQEAEDLVMEEAALAIHPLAGTIFYDLFKDTGADSMTVSTADV
jgi:hypothetical protein